MSVVVIVGEPESVPEGRRPPAHALPTLIESVVALVPPVLGSSGLVVLLFSIETLVEDPVEENSVGADDRRPHPQRRGIAEGSLSDAPVF